MEYIHAESQNLTISDLIALNSTKYNVPAHTLIAIIKCESNFNSKAINHTEKEYSVGLSQINLKSHKGISKADAENPSFAIEYLAKNIANNTDHWSCQKLI